jgi:hypothetical protein|eukprot:SAG11_NODE_5_length_32399_cov_6.724118_17_plen_153_part_00
MYISLKNSISKYNKRQTEGLSISLRQNPFTFSTKWSSPIPAPHLLQSNTSPFSRFVRSGSKGYAEGTESLALYFHLRERFIQRLMKDGKKAVAVKIFDESLELLKREINLYGSPISKATKETKGRDGGFSRRGITDKNKIPKGKLNPGKGPS